MIYAQDFLISLLIEWWRVSLNSSNNVHMANASNRGTDRAVQLSETFAEV